MTRPDLTPVLPDQTRAAQRRGHIYYDLFCLACLLPLADFLLRWTGLCPDQLFSCSVPVAPGLQAPITSIVLIGLALCLRDLVQKELGIAWALTAMIAGWAGFALFFWWLSPAPHSVMLGSLAGWAAALLADFAVWTPLAARRRFLLAAAASGIAGAFVDSAVFLFLAFGDLHQAAAFTIGKIWIVLACVFLFRQMGLFTSGENRLPS